MQERIGLTLRRREASHLALLPQGDPERETRVQKMVAQMDAGGIRRLLQYLRLRGRVPEEDLRSTHRQDELRVSKIEDRRYRRDAEVIHFTREA